MHALLFCSVCLLQAPPTPQVLEAKDLPKINGPIAPKVHDLAGGMGAEIQMTLRRSARTTSLAAVQLPAGALEVRDTMYAIPGWKAYRVEVPAHGKVKVRLRGPHEAWFRVLTVNKWGEMEAGMLQNKIPTGNPEASYINPKAEANSVYFVVDSTDLAVEGEGYTLFVTYP